MTGTATALGNTAPDDFPIKKPWNFRGISQWFGHVWTRPGAEQGWIWDLGSMGSEVAKKAVLCTSSGVVVEDFGIIGIEFLNPKYFGPMDLWNYSNPFPLNTPHKHP